MEATSTEATILKAPSDIKPKPKDRQAEIEDCPVALYPPSF
jgi:hypothetical protein